MTVQAIRNETLVEFGARVRAYRHRHQLSIGWFAAECLLSKSFLCELERGRSMPSAETLARLAEAMGITMNELWCGVGRCEPVGEVV
jgi:transcriptional regulator with XRE-family HTH domain